MSKEMSEKIEILHNQIKEYIEKVKTEVFFDKEDHIYRRISDDFFLTGVTTILGVRNKDFLKWWSVKEGVKYLGWFDKKEENEEAKQNLVKRFSEIKSLSVDGYWKELDNAKKAHTVKSKAGKDKGKLAHEWCEGFIKEHLQADMGNRLPVIPVYPDDPDVCNSVTQFVNWTKGHDVKWLASEMIIWSPKHLFAGILDWLAIVDGVFTLGDIKTSSMIGEESFLQTGAYSISLLEAGIIPEQRLVIRIPKDGAGFEPKIVPTDLSFDMECFIALRTAHRWNLYLKNKFCDEDGKLKI